MIDASEAPPWLNLLKLHQEMLCSLAVLPGRFWRRLLPVLMRMLLWSGLCVEPRLHLLIGDLSRSSRMGPFAGASGSMAGWIDWARFQRVSSHRDCVGFCT